MRSPSVATAIFEYLTNGLDCLSDPTTIGPHPEAGCRSLSTHRAENLTPVLGAHRSAKARACGVVQELCPAWAVTGVSTSTPGLQIELASWCRAVVSPKGIGSAHVQPGQIAIIQKSHLGRRRCDDLADDGMRNSESD
jgi:hypothetical protein